MYIYIRKGDEKMTKQIMTCDDCFEKINNPIHLLGPGGFSSGNFCKECAEKRIKEDGYKRSEEIGMIEKLKI